MPHRRILVVVPAYNAETFLAATIESILVQQWLNLSLVIVDDASSDNTAAIARAFAARDDRVRIRTLPENVGPSVARNIGAATCESDFLAFLDADDTWTPQFMPELAHALDRRADAVGAIGEVRHIDATGHPLDDPSLKEGERRLYGRRFGLPGTLPPAADVDFGALAASCCIRTPGAVLLRTRAFVHARGFDPAVDRCEDWDLWLRMARHGPFVTTGVSALNYRWHGSNLSMDTDALSRSSELVLQKARISSANTREQRVLLSRGYRARHLTLAQSKAAMAITAILDRQPHEVGRQAWYGLGHLLRAARWSVPPSISRPA